MRKNKPCPGNYYHVFNRGNNKQIIFSDQKDWARLLFLILYCQSPINFYNIGRQTSNFVRHRVFNIPDNITEEIIQKSYIKLINFCLMPNHFHLTLLELEKDGIARYMQRILNAYTKYFNTKYEKSGHLFQGPYKTVHIENNEQLLYLSTYIHRNPREFKEWKNREESYPWSSYQDYIKENRWKNLLDNGVIVKQFKDKTEYQDFLTASPAKDILEDDLRLDC